MLLKSCLLFYEGYLICWEAYLKSLDMKEVGSGEQHKTGDKSQFYVG